MSHLKLITEFQFFFIVVSCDYVFQQGSWSALRKPLHRKSCSFGGTLCAVIQTAMYFHISPAHGASTLPALLSWSRAAGSTWCWIISSHPQKLRLYRSGGSSKFRLSMAVPKALFIARKGRTQWRTECRWLWWNTDDSSESSFWLKGPTKKVLNSLSTSAQKHRFSRACSRIHNVLGFYWISTVFFARQP